MTNEQRRSMESLCRRIVQEQDQNVFMHLIMELNELLESREHHLRSFPATTKVNGNGHRNGYNPYQVLAGTRQIPELLTLMIDATAADFGNVQLFDSSRSGLRIVAQQGFGEEFLNYFETVCGGNSSCGAAMNQRSRITVSDILTDPLFEDARTQSVMLRARVRACQSTPLFDKRANLIGVVSTHFQQPTRFDPDLWKRVDTVVANFVDKLPPAAMLSA